VPTDDSMTSRGVLDIDVGNSRVKWRYQQAGRIERGASPRDDRWLETLPPGVDPGRIRVSSVAGSAADARLSDALAHAFEVAPEFARPRALLDGLRCGYAQPETLGVDRWLAVLAAWSRTRTAAVVVDAGSALTLDVLTDAGAHLGGYIVPGLRLMSSALFRGTAQVKVDFSGGAEGLEPGTATPDAVAHGLLRMTTDFIEASVARFERSCQHAVRLILCGGDAEIVAPRLEHAVELVPELVLDGLAIAIP